MIRRKSLSLTFARTALCVAAASVMVAEFYRVLSFQESDPSEIFSSQESRYQLRGRCSVRDNHPGIKNLRSLTYHFDTYELWVRDDSLGYSPIYHEAMFKLYRTESGRKMVDEAWAYLKQSGEDLSRCRDPKVTRAPWEIKV